MARKRYSITEREWGLLDRLTSAADMDWFFDETTRRIRETPCGPLVAIEYEPKGYLTEGQVRNSSCAFLAEDLWRFTREEVMEMREFYVRCGIPAEGLDREIERCGTTVSGQGGAGRGILANGTGANRS